MLYRNTSVSAAFAIRNTDANTARGHGQRRTASGASVCLLLMLMYGRCVCSGRNDLCHCVMLRSIVVCVCVQVVEGAALGWRAWAGT